MPINFGRSVVSGRAPVSTDLGLGELAVNTYDGKLYRMKGQVAASIVEIGGSARSSRSRERPAPSPSGKIDFGLGNVDQSADASTPVSTATQPALNAKVDTSSLGSASGLSSAGGDLPANRTTHPLLPAQTTRRR